MGYNQAKQDMTLKIKIVSLLIVYAMLFFVGCKKNNSENETNEINETPEETLDELIPEEILQLLDNCPSVNYQDPSVFGFNGKSDNPLDNLFAAMCSKAMELTDNTPYGEGNNKQQGLAYVYGRGLPESYEKDYRIRRRGTASVCTDSLYGIDCSGFIAHVMNAAEVGEINVAGRNVLVEMKAHEQVSYFKNLKRLRTSQYTGLVKVEEFENVSVTDIKNGDIIYKIKAIGNNTATHIGIFLKTTTGKLIMFQSSGDPSYTCQQNRHESEHGPIQKEINQDNLNSYFYANSGRARLLRISADTNWVDLGLPSGILWATRNEAADSPNEFGAYFAWADIIEKPYYDWEHYRYWNNGSIIKYNAIDGLTTLQPADDAATVYLENETGSRMPTRQDWQELFDNTTNIWTTQKGVYGRLFTASNGNSLFLPAAGFRHLDGLFSVGEFGIYWSSSRSENDPYNAWYARFNADTLAISEYIRLFGLSIRPVRVLPSNKD